MISIPIIYKVTNTINGKIYIGQTWNTLEYRINQHFREAKDNNRTHVYFHNAIRKYGEENFSIEIIDHAETQEELDEKERYWITYYDSNNKSKGYNLDSGGKSGGKKSESTKRKIGETTLQKWENPATAEKMREGLLKGIETMKKNAKKYIYICPICGKMLFLQKYQLKIRKYCSPQCAGKSNMWEKGVKESAIKNHERNVERKEIIKQDILQWLYNNQDLVMTCPYNKITTTLSGLLDMIKEKYNIIDIRTIFLCFDVKGRKELLDAFKKEITLFKENVC